MSRQNLRKRYTYHTRTQLPDGRTVNHRYRYSHRLNYGLFDVIYATLLTIRHLEGPVQIDLFIGPPSGRHARRHWASTGQRLIENMIDANGRIRLTYREPVNSSAGLPYGDFAYDVDLGQINMGLDVGVDVNLPEPGSLAKFIAEQDIDISSTYSLCPRVLPITPEMEESAEMVRRALTTLHEGPAPKRVGPIRMMSESELRPEAMAWLMASDVTVRESVLKELDVLKGLIEPKSGPEDHIVDQTVNLSRVEEISANYHLGFTPADFDGNALQSSERDSAYDQWLRRRDRDVELVGSMVKSGQLVLDSASPNGGAYRTIRAPGTMDKIRHNCEDPSMLQRLTQLVHAEPIMTPLYENGKPVLNADGTPFMVIDESLMTYPTVEQFVDGPKQKD